MSKTVSLLALVGLAASANAAITIVATNTSFTNIAVSGTALTTSDDAEINLSAATLSGAGFTGNELLGLSNIRVGNNGGVLWNATTGDVGYINSTTFGTMAGAGPASGNFGNGGLQAGVQFVAPLWDDNTPGTGGGLRWQVVGGNLIIQWTNQDHFNASGSGTVTYQMVVYSGVTIASGQKLVEFVYDDTLYDASRYQNDGGSATIGFKNWGVNANANDVEFGVGGGTNTLGDPAFGDASMMPKVAGWTLNGGSTGPHSVAIIPAPGAMALLGLGGLLAARRRR